MQIPLLILSINVFYALLDPIHLKMNKAAAESTGLVLSSLTLGKVNAQIVQMEAILIQMSLAMEVLHLASQVHTIHWNVK